MVATWECAVVTQGSCGPCKSVPVLTSIFTKPSASPYSPFYSFPHTHKKALIALESAPSPTLLTFNHLVQET